MPPDVDHFTQAIDFWWRPENDGQPFHVRPGDPGGATHWGVTYRVWAAWEAAHGRVPTVEIFQTQPRVTMLPLLRMNYWDACRCSTLSFAGIPVFDMAGNGGPGAAVLLLQRIVGVSADGIFGPVTLRAVRNAPLGMLVDAYGKARLAHYSGLRQAAENPGWFRRAKDCTAYTMQLMGAQAPASTAERKPDNG